MNSTLSTWQKWWFCFVCMLLLYAAAIYTMDVVAQGQLSWATLPQWVFRFLLNTVVALVWFWCLEWMLAQLKKVIDATTSRNRVFWLYLAGGIGMLIAGVLVVWLMQPLRDWFWIFTTNSPEIREYTTRVTFGLIICITVCGFLALANRQIWLSMENIHVQADRMEKENLQSKISALNNQVNPHFLFNSLSILSSLVRQDADKSEQFIQQLSKAYRYILERRDTDIVPLAEELSFLEAYAFLLKTRFEGKFAVQFQLDPALVHTTCIAPLTLQLLVENAVKHNRMSEKEPLIIQISTHKGILQISNSIRERGEKAISTGLGLQNIINRYAILSERPVWVGERNGDFVVEVPLIPMD